MKTNKYQRCVVNIPNLQPVFKSALTNQSIDSFNEDDCSPPSPAPPQVPLRKVSLPIELRNNESDETVNSLKSNQNQFTFNESPDFKNHTKYLSFNHSTPTINNLNQFRYSLYFNKLKQEEYQKQLEQNKLEQEQLSESSFVDAKSISSSLRSINQNLNSNLNNNLISNQEDENNEEIRPSTSASSNTTRIMINFKK